MLRTLILMAVVGGVVGAEHAAWAQRAPVGFYRTGVTDDQLCAISSDGTTAVGFAPHPEFRYAQPLRWSYSGGRQVFPLGPGMRSTILYDVSADGSVAVGNDTLVTALQFGSGPIQNRGRHADHDGTQMVGLSGNGLVAVGSVVDVIQPPDIESRAARWSEAAGFEELPLMPGYASESSALATNFDGSVIVGEAGGEFGYTGWRYTDARGYTSLRGPRGNSERASAVSPDGQWVAGMAARASDARSTAMRWGPDDSYLVLDPAQTFRDSEALGISTDGTTVVGMGFFPGGVSGFVWQEDRGMRLVADVLAEAGVHAPVGVVLTSVTAVSADGLVFAGRMSTSPTEFEAWVAVIPSPGAALPFLAAFTLAARRRRRLPDPASGWSSD